MKDTKGLVKCILGFVLSIAMIVGASFGLDVKVNVQDTENTPTEVVETTEANVEEVETTTEENVLETEQATQEVTEEVVETEQPTVEPTETVDQEPTVEEPVENEVTVPTDETQEQ